MEKGFLKVLTVERGPAVPEDKKPWDETSQGPDCWRHLGEGVSGHRTEKLSCMQVF